MRRRLVEQVGNRWRVCRMENATMRVFVGEYGTEWAAKVAHSVSVQHLEERDKWLAEHNKSLKSRIQAAIDAKNNESK